MPQYDFTDEGAEAPEKPKTKKFGTDKSVEIVCKGRLESVDAYCARFKLEPDQRLKSAASVVLVPGVLPGDFEPERYEVSAEVVIRVKAVAKEMPING